MDGLVEKLALRAKAELKGQLRGKPLFGGSESGDWFSWPGSGSVELTDIVRACLGELEAAGYRIVPAEPTDDMRRVARTYFGMNPFEPNNQPYDHLWLNAFKSMLSVAPKFAK